MGRLQGIAILALGALCIAACDKLLQNGNDPSQGSINRHTSSRTLVRAGNRVFVWECLTDADNDVADPKCLAGSDHRSGFDNNTYFIWALAALLSGDSSSYAPLLCHGWSSYRCYSAFGLTNDDFDYWRPYSCPSSYFWNSNFLFAGQRGCGYWGRTWDPPPPPGSTYLVYGYNQSGQYTSCNPSSSQVCTLAITAAEQQWRNRCSASYYQLNICGCTALCSGYIQ